MKRVFEDPIEGSSGITAYGGSSNSNSPPNVLQDTTNLPMKKMKKEEVPSQGDGLMVTLSDSSLHGEVVVKKQPTTLPAFPFQQISGYDSQGQIRNIDNNDNYGSLSGFSSDIYTCLGMKEKCNIRPPRFPQPNCRLVLYEWLIELTHSFMAPHGVLFTAVQISDKFLERQGNVPLNLLQLIGACSFRIGYSFFGIEDTLSIEDVIHVTVNQYDKQEVICAERTILNCIDWQISLAGCPDFLERYLLAVNANEQTRQLTYFIAEVSIICNDLVIFLPSMIAISSVILALYLLNKSYWTLDLEEVSGYSRGQFQVPLSILYRFLQEIDMNKPYSFIRHYERLSGIKLTSMLLPANEPFHNCALRCQNPAFEDTTFVFQSEQ